MAIRRFVRASTLDATTRPLLPVEARTALSASLDRVLQVRTIPVEARSRVLFNHDTRSANFFIPFPTVVLCQMMAIMLSAIAIVREKERGTLKIAVLFRKRPG